MCTKYSNKFPLLVKIPKHDFYKALIQIKSEYVYLNDDYIYKFYGHISLSKFKNKVDFEEHSESASERP